MSKFKIGDKVVVVNTGRAFTTYTKMAELMELDSYQREYSPENGDVGVVSAKSYHEDGILNYGILYGVVAGDHQFIIEENGLELYKEPVEVPTPPDVSFPFFFKHINGEHNNSGFAYIDSDGKFLIFHKSGQRSSWWTEQQAIDFVKRGLWIPQEEPILPDEFWIQYNGGTRVFYKGYVNDATGRLSVFDVKDRFIVDYYIDSVVEFLKEGSWSIVEEPQHYKRRKEINKLIEALEEELKSL